MSSSTRTDWTRREHQRYATWFKALVEAPEPFAVAGIVLAGFLRIVTNPKIFRPPTPMARALAFCRTLVEWPEPFLSLRAARTEISL